MHVAMMKFECAACGHDALIPPSSLLHGLRLPPYTPVLDLEPRLRWRECDPRRKAVVSIRSAVDYRSSSSPIQNSSICRNVDKVRFRAGLFSPVDAIVSDLLLA